MTEIKNRLQFILDQIRSAEKNAQRTPRSVQLLAVSKTWPAEVLRQLAEQGQHQFGENYLQEALVKIEALSDLDLEWHFIGPIQSNKTRDISSFFSWVHSVDRAKIAHRLHQQRPEHLPALNVCIQLNIDAEESKSGISEADMMALAAEIHALDKLTLRGLMVIPAKHDDEQAQRRSFKRACQRFQQLQTHYPQVDTLSMGMTGDMQAAIAEGSTMVRIGTALFGERQPRT